MYFYKAYGLNISSEFRLPPLMEGGNGKDLLIKKAKLHPPLEFDETTIFRHNIEAFFAQNGQDLFIHWKGMATLQASNGNTLLVEPEDEFGEELLCMYIISEALGMILFQRGIFLLHGSAVMIGNKALVFVGAPGAGKSTTVAAFAKAGYVVLADDMVAITVSDDKISVIPGYPQIKIWPSAIVGLEFIVAETKRIHEKTKKRVIRNKNGFPDKAVPLSTIYLLHESPDQDEQVSQSLQSHIALTKYFPIPSQLLEGERQQNHFNQIKNILEKIDIKNLFNPKSFEILKNTVKRISVEYLT